MTRVCDYIISAAYGETAEVYVSLSQILEIAKDLGEDIDAADLVAGIQLHAIKSEVPSRMYAHPDDLNRVFLKDLENS